MKRVRHVVQELLLVSLPLLAPPWHATCGTGEGDGIGLGLGIGLGSWGLGDGTAALGLGLKAAVDVLGLGDWRATGRALAPHAVTRTTDASRPARIRILEG